MRWEYVSYVSKSSKSSKPICYFCKLNESRTLWCLETSKSSPVIFSTINQLQKYDCTQQIFDFDQTFVKKYPHTKNIQKTRPWTPIFFNKSTTPARSWVLFWNFLKACLAGPSSKPCDSKDDKDLESEPSQRRFCFFIEGKTYMNHSSMYRVNIRYMYLHENPSSMNMI